MKLHQMTWLSLLAVVPVWAQPAGQIEPNAGTWKTWAISFTKDYRVPPPPDAATTAAELQWLHGYVGQTDPSVAQQISFGMLVRQDTVGLI